jgi:myo-inositol 2-dehydrogenase / D-chiro-inositol 1-dehydrogenase
MKGREAMSTEGVGKQHCRRGFLGSAGAGLMILRPETVFGTQANSAVEFGLVGCGSRGTWIGASFQEFTGARLVALADVLPDRMEAVSQKIKAASSTRRYKGLQGYQELAASKLDVVVIESPPYCHPEQAAAAIQAGRHVYMAKPVAVDVAGCRSIIATGEKAKGKLSFFVDFQFRAREVFRELASRVHGGAIGRPVLGHVYYHTGRLRRKDQPGDSAAVARMRNWVFDKALSGDIIVEQNVHALDAGDWLLNARPVQAYGTGGRKARVDVGDCWDHFVVAYWYPDDVKVDFSSTQCIKGYNDICARVYGVEGTAEARYNGTAVITGPQPWKGAEKDDTGRQGTIDNIRMFVENVRAGRTVDNAAEAAGSTLTAVLGRMAAYGQRIVTWDEMMRSNEKLDYKLEGLA